MKYIICSFFGHRNTPCTDAMYSLIKTTVEKLITEDGVNIFSFGSQSEFELICLKAVTELKKMYPYIRRLYVRAEYKYIDDENKEFVSKNYDDTFCPVDRSVWISASVKRSYYMIENSEHCIFYYNEN